MDESRRGQFGRIFETFANVLLERGLPHIRQWLTARLGPGARLESMEVDGTRVHLIDAHVPLGPFVIRASRATFVAHAEDLMAGLAPVHLEKLTGTIEILGGLAPIRGQIEIEGEPPPTGAEWIHGRCTLRALRVGDETFDGSASLSVSAERVCVENGVLDGAGGARTTIFARGSTVRDAPRIDEVHVTATSMPLELLFAALSALRGAARLSSLPLVRRARFDGFAKLLDEDMQAAFVVRGGRSELRTELETSAGHVRRLVASGVVAWNDLVTENARTSFGPIDGAPIAIDLTASGPRDLNGTVRCERIDTELLGVPVALDVRAVSSALEMSLGGDDVDLRGNFSIGELLQGRLRGTLGSIALSSMQARGPLSIGATLGGTLENPRLDASVDANGLVVHAGERSWPLERVRANVALDREGAHGSARARIGSGAIRISRERGAPLRLRAERVRADALLPVFDVPLARDAQLWADVAISEGIARGVAHAESARSRLSLDPVVVSLRDRALDGTKVHGLIALEDVVGSGWEGQLDLALTILRLSPAHLAEARVEGAVHARSIAFVPHDRPRVRFEAPSARLELRAGNLKIANVRTRVFGGELRLGATFGVASRRFVCTELALEGIGAGLGEWLVGSRIPELSIDAALERRDSSLQGTWSVRAERSALYARTIVEDDGALREAELDGSLACRDLEGLFDSLRVRPSGDAVWKIRGRARGSLRDPHLVLEANAPEQSVALQGQGVELSFSDARATIELSRDRLVWRELSARGYGGRFSSRGSLLAMASGADIEIEGVRLADLPFPSPIEGTLNARFGLLRPRGNTVIGGGSVRIGDPSYVFLERARPLAAKLELPLPPLASEDELRAELRLSTDRFRVGELSARLSSFSVRGRLDVKRDGEIDGHLAFVAEREWLQKSRFIAPLAAVLSLSSIPLHLGGTLEQPRVRADLMRAADGILARSAIGRRLRATLIELAPSIFELPKRAGDSEATHGTASLLSTETLLDRLAEDRPDAEELLHALLDRGLRCDEIAFRLAQRR